MLHFKKAVAVVLLAFLFGSVFTLGISAQAADAKASVSITADNVEVVVGQTIGLHAQTSGFSAAPAITWKSDDPAVATVDANGAVTGVKVGRATITAVAKSKDEQAADSFVIYVIKSRQSLKSLLDRGQVLGYKYSFRDDYYYTNDKQCWQSNFGFAKLYDLIAPYVLLEYDYVRVYFTYEDKDWMIQLWKGQYGLLFYGAEQGVYTRAHSDKEINAFTFYRCADQSDWLNMEMTLYHDTGDGTFERELTREYGEYWWCTGFKSGHLRQQEPASELRTVGTIVCKDPEMTRLFSDGLEQLGFTRKSTKAALDLDSFCVEGNSVSFIWQNINDAETTMPIKYASYTALGVGAGMLAFFIGIFAFFAMMLAGFVLLIIIL